MKKLIFLFCLFATTIMAKDILMVSVPPQKYFVEQIAKDKFEVVSMMDTNSILPTFAPPSLKYIYASKAKAYLKTGMPDEELWLSKIKNKNKNIYTFDLNENNKDYLSISEFYSWLDPIIAKTQIKNILNALIQIDSKNEEFYKKNYLKFTNKISSLDYQIRSIFKKHKLNNFIVFSPVWTYFCKRYKINQLEIDIDIYTTNEKEITQILQRITSLLAKVIILPKDYFPKRLYDKIANKNGIEVASISHLAYNWEENLLNLAKIIAYQPRKRDN